MSAGCERTPLFGRIISLASAEESTIANFPKNFNKENLP